MVKFGFEFEFDKQYSDLESNVNSDSERIMISIDKTFEWLNINEAIDIVNKILSYLKIESVTIINHK